MEKLKWKHNVARQSYESTDFYLIRKEEGKYFLSFNKQRRIIGMFNKLKSAKTVAQLLFNG